MRFCGPVIATVAAFIFAALPAMGQFQAPSEKLLMTAKTAATWSQGTTDVVQLEGPVTIELDRATLSADRAVLWITPEAAAANGRGPSTQQVQVSLIGNAKVRQPQLGSTRSGDRILVTAEVAGRIRLTADQSEARDLHDTPAYREADAIRTEVAAPATSPATVPAGPSTDQAPAEPPNVSLPATEPVAPADSRTDPATMTTAASTMPVTTRPSTRPAAKALPVAFDAGDVQTVDADDGTVATVLSGDVVLRQRRESGELLELFAKRAVLFTRLKSLRDLQKSEGRTHGQNEFTGAYLEGDVRIRYTPIPVARKPSFAEQRLDANRVYYEFATDRAILTDAVIHTVNPQPPLPIIIRAKLVRQMAEGEYKAEKAQLSSSSFARPTFGIAADRIYIREEPGETAADMQVVYDARGAGLGVFGVPLIKIPHISGVADNSEGVLRSIGTGHQSQFGTEVTSEWGLFQALGITPPRDLDVSFRGDYYTNRGPATGLNANYAGGISTDASKEASNFEGSFRSFFVYDHGSDDVGRPTPTASGDSRLRGFAEFQHQQFLPDNWQVQLRSSWVSDQEFLEQYFPRSFDTDQPRDTSIYVKHQVDNEALTLLYQFQPNDLVTSSDFFQNQFEVEHIPEIGYRRIGDSLANDKFTFFSQNTFDGLYFQHTRASLREEGFINGISPGLPSLGTTGTTNQTVYRADFRQELDYPIDAGQFKLVPYVMARYTAYSDSPSDGAKNRLMAAAGAKISTAFWKTDDTVESDLFDLHRMRHVIEPEVDLFTSTETVHRDSVFIYDPEVDPVNDISAASFGLRQRWETYRGGPGRWRSVDFLTLNIEADLYANQPTKQQLAPYGFRGLYFPSEPEISIPRNAINANMQWRISDNTVLLVDAQENLDETKLATAAIGLVVRRDVQLDYYLGNRYIAQLDSSITTLAIDYAISPKYTVSFSQSVDFGLGKNVESVFAVVRRFDNCFLLVTAYTDETNHTNGFGFSIIPSGASAGLNTQAFDQTRR